MTTILYDMLKIFILDIILQITNFKLQPHFNGQWDSRVQAALDIQCFPPIVFNFCASSKSELSFYASLEVLICRDGTRACGSNYSHCYTWNVIMHPCLTSVATWLDCHIITPNPLLGYDNVITYPNQCLSDLPLSEIDPWERCRSNAVNFYPQTHNSHPSTRSCEECWITSYSSYGCNYLYLPLIPASGSMGHVEVTVSIILLFVSALHFLLATLHTSGLCFSFNHTSFEYFILCWNTETAVTLRDVICIVQA